jgi:phosphatidylglycerol:prolipoprotein diacylglycerol transferase
VLPVLLTLRIPAGWGLPVALLAVVVIGLVRALGVARGAAGARLQVFRDALRDDRWVLGGLAVAAIAAGVAGVFRGEQVLPLPSYGVLLAAAFVVGLWLARREARRCGQDPEAISDLTFWLIVAGLLGSQVFYVLLNLEEFSGARFWGETPFGQWPRFLIVWRTGLVFYGGVIGAGLTAIVYLRRRRMAFLAHADTLVPSVAFGHFLGRVGCFLAGCCWGSRAGDGVPWAVRFPVGSGAYAAFASEARYGPEFLAPDHLHTALLHPAQLYEAFGELAIFFALVLLVRPRKRFQGQVLATWLLASAVLRGVVELFRGDLARRLVGPFNSGQWTSVAILAAGAAVWILAPRARQEPPNAGTTPETV